MRFPVKWHFPTSVDWLPATSLHIDPCASETQHRLWFPEYHPTVYCLPLFQILFVLWKEFLLPILPLPKLFYMLKLISTFLSPPKILFPLWSLHSLLNPLLLQCCLISWLNFNYCSYQYCTISLHIVSYLKMLRFWRCSCFEKFGY
jgi:hypothetical protein